MAQTAQAEERFFCWIGGGGYTMVGRMVFPDVLATAQLITQDDVTEFEIIGYFEGDYIGSWDQMRLNDDTSWLLRYQPDQGVFPLVGWSGLYQMWNANGQVNDCGEGGFGFNAGNAGQDVCVDNTYIASSSIDWDTPITTQSSRPEPTCSGEMLLGKSSVNAGAAP